MYLLVSLLYHFPSFPKIPVRVEVRRNNSGRPYGRYMAQLHVVDIFLSKPKNEELFLYLISRRAQVSVPRKQIHGQTQHHEGHGVWMLEEHAADVLERGEGGLHSCSHSVHRGAI
jgi:hypothetical protein